MNTDRRTDIVSHDFILEALHLTREFRGFKAVDNVNLQVRRGQIHALLGPNGAGKTTCFNLLTKFLMPTSGRIVFNGRDITAELPPKSLAGASSGRSRYPPCSRT